MSLPPIEFDVRRCGGWYVFREDDNGEEFIACEYGRIVAVNPDNGADGCFAAVLIGGTPAQKRRLVKLGPILWQTVDELAVRLLHGRFVKVTTILKPLERPQDD